MNNRWGLDCLDQMHAPPMPFGTVNVTLAKGAASAITTLSVPAVTWSRKKLAEVVAETLFDR